MIPVDINCDCGENLPGLNDIELMPFISSCSIACGGHAGDVSTMQYTISAAIDHGVKIGAHPSLPDRAGFGRVWKDIQEEILFNSIVDQITLFYEIATSMGATIHHIKAHGALYNQAAVNQEIAQVLIHAIKHLPVTVKIYAPPGSLMAAEAKNTGISVYREVFADRQYLPNGSLVPRSSHDALISRKEQVLQRVVEVFTGNYITAVDSTKIEVQAETICFHGDHLGAIELLQFIHSQLPVYDLKPDK